MKRDPITMLLASVWDCFWNKHPLDGWNTACIDAKDVIVCWWRNDPE